MSDNEIDILITGKDEASEALAGARKGVEGLDDAVTRAGGGSGGGGRGIAGMASMLGGPLTVGAGAAGAALIGVGVAAFSTAADFDTAMRDMQAQLGLTQEEAEALRPAIEETFTSGLVGSATEAATAVAEARRQLRGLSEEELTGATERALLLSNTFGEDYGKVLNSINTLQSEFGLTFDEASNFVTAGFQRGLNSSGDFLDSIGEYSTQFSNGGADAGQFFSVLETGLSGGMLGTDKAADAFKEFRLRIQDGSKATNEGLALLGINMEEFTGKLASGEITAAEAFQTIVDEINATEDPTIRMQAGAALIGSQFEDLGDSAFQGLSLAQTSMEDLSGATDSLDAQTQGLGLQWEQTKRELLLALAPVGEEMLALGQEIMPYVVSGAEQISSWLGENLPGILEGFSQWLTDVREGADLVGGAFSSLNDWLTDLGDGFNTLRSNIGNIKDALPDWLTPGSPTPLEIGVRGLDRALEQTARGGLPDFASGLELGAMGLPNGDPLAFGAAGAAGAGGTIAINVAGSVTTERDLFEAARLYLDEYARRNV